MPIIGFVTLGSEEAQLQKDDYYAQHPPKEATPVPPAAPDFDDLLAIGDRTNVCLFPEFCDQRLSTCWDPQEDAPPRWERLDAKLRAQLIRAAKTYLNGCCVPTTSWIETAQVWSTVTHGYWALRLLAQVVPAALDQLSDDVWYAWMPSVFGDHWRSEVPDGVHTAILKAAYRRVPARFRELLGRFVDSQNKGSGDVFVLDRAIPVWDSEIADFLRSKLPEETLQPRAFRDILSVLIAAGDAAATGIAKDLVAAASDTTPETLERPVAAALALLRNDPAGGWKMVWPTCLANAAFAESLVSRFTADPYSAATTQLISGLGENELADLAIWIYVHHLKHDEAPQGFNEGPRVGPFTVITRDKGWRWLSIVVMSDLIRRGTATAMKAIRRIREVDPDIGLARAEKAVEESVRQRAWVPMSPSQFLDLALAQGPEIEQHPDRLPGLVEMRKPKHSGKRSVRYETIDTALKQIADSRPRTQEEIFEQLQTRQVRHPPVEPFLAAGGWMAGFKGNEIAARSWLSKRWSNLSLPPLPRGPKTRK